MRVLNFIPLKEAFLSNIFYVIIVAFLLAGCSNNEDSIIYEKLEVTDSDSPQNVLL